MAIFIFEYMSLKMHSAVFNFFLWFIPLRQRAKVNIGPASRIDLAAFRSAVKCVRSAGLRCALIRGKHVLLEEKKGFHAANIINMAGYVSFICGKV